MLIITTLMVLGGVSLTPAFVFPPRGGGGGGGGGSSSPDTSMIVHVKAHGAQGDAKVATDCAMTAASAVLTCATNQFGSGDVGKVIAVYGAGPTTNGYIQPLSSTISTFTSATQVTLADAATATINPSTRTVWGTNDTASLQAAVDALAASDGQGGNIGGIVQFPPGHYLTRGMNLPCSRIGTFTNGTCTKTYNNIWIRGAGRGATIVENWDISVTHVAATAGIITLGFFAEPVEAGNTRLTDITISDLTLRQIEHPTFPVKVISAYASTAVSILRTRGIGPAYECYVMGGGTKSTRWTVRDNIMGPCGTGGPARSSSTSALNLNGEEWVATDNEIRDSGQGVEMGSRRAQLLNNRIYCTGVTASPLHAVNTGSTGVGIWDNTIAGNHFEGCGGGAVVFTNTIGTNNRNMVLNNRFVDSGLNLQSGRESNSVVEGTPDDTIHGTSVIQGNVFIFRGDRPTSGPMVIGRSADPQGGLENVRIIDNRIVFGKSYIQGGASDGEECLVDADGPGGTCRLPLPIVVTVGPYGGGAKWLPSTVYALNAHTVPRVNNDHYYVVTEAGTSGTSEPTWPTTIDSTVVDGTVTWRNSGKRPTVTVDGLHVSGPQGAKSFGNDIRFLNSGYREVLKLFNLWANYAYKIEASGTDDHATENVPAGVIYSDRARWSAAQPTVGVFALGAIVNKEGATATPFAWRVTRAGRAAPAWVLSTAYGYGVFRAPTADNAHVYLQTVAAGCTSAGSEPSWPTGAGATVADNDCVWREAGASALFVEE